MKTIVFVRHGKSSWKHSVSDIHRPLKKRGFIDAENVSVEFLKHNFHPDLVVSSPAKRAIDICNIFIEKMIISDEKLQINPIIYDFGGTQIADFIESLDNNYQKVMLFGHNYAFTSLVNRFGSIYIENLPTSGLVKIDFDIDSWEDVNKGVTSLVLFPKNLR